MEKQKKYSYLIFSRLDEMVSYSSDVAAQEGWELHSWQFTDQRVYAVFVTGWENTRVL